MDDNQIIMKISNTCVQRNKLVEGLNKRKKTMTNGFH